MRFYHLASLLSICQVNCCNSVILPPAELLRENVIRKYKGGNYNITKKELVRFRMTERTGKRRNECKISSSANKSFVSSWFIDKRGFINYYT